jgi:ATP-dependent Clp protease protease subunit
MDLPSRLLEDRIVMLTGEVGDENAAIIVSELLYLDSTDSTKPIDFYVNSPGGSISAGCAIIDTMKFVRAPIRTIGMGTCASMGAVILSAGEMGMRMALPYTRVLLHQASGGSRGQVLDIKTQYDELIRMNELMLEELAKNCNKDKETLRRDCDRDYWMSADEAVNYGVIDKVINKA